jgi:hypothetical protein
MHMHAHGHTAVTLWNRNDGFLIVLNVCTNFGWAMYEVVEPILSLTWTTWTEAPYVNVSSKPRYFDDCSCYRGVVVEISLDYSCWTSSDLLKKLAALFNLKTS